MDYSSKGIYFERIYRMFCSNMCEDIENLIPSIITQKEDFPKEICSEINIKFQTNMKSVNAEEMCIIFNNVPAFIYFKKLEQISEKTIELSIIMKKYDIIKSFIDDNQYNSVILPKFCNCDEEMLSFLSSLSNFNFDATNENGDSVIDILAAEKNYTNFKYFVEKCSYSTIKNSFYKVIINKNNDFIQEFIKSKYAHQLISDKYDEKYTIMQISLIKNPEAMKILIGFEGIDVLSSLALAVCRNMKEEMFYILNIIPSNVNCGIFVKYLIDKDKNDILRALAIKEFPAISQATIKNIPPIMYATILNKVESLRALLSSKNANINKRDPDGFSALHIAVSKKYTDCIRLLILHPKIDVNAVDNKYRMTALQIATKNNDINSLSLLLDHPSIETDIPSFNGMTPFSEACDSGRNSIVEMLYNAGKINCNRIDKYFLTPLMHACHKNHFSTVKYLIEECKVDPLINTPVGTAFGISLKVNAENVIRYLVEKDAFDPQLPELNNYPVQDYAYHLNNEELRKYVLDAIEKKTITKQEPNNYIGTLYS